MQRYEIWEAWGVVSAVIKLPKWPNIVTCPPVSQVRVMRGVPARLGPQGSRMDHIPWIEDVSRGFETYTAPMRALVGGKAKNGVFEI